MVYVINFTFINYFRYNQKLLEYDLTCPYRDEEKFKTIFSHQEKSTSTQKAIIVQQNAMRNSMEVIKLELEDKPTTNGVETMINESKTRIVST